MTGGGKPLVRALMLALALSLICLAPFSAVPAEAGLIGSPVQIKDGCWWPDVCYNAYSNQYLVLWGDYNVVPLVKAQRIDANTGAVLGSEIPISNWTDPYRSYMGDAVYNSVNHEWFVVYVFCVVNQQEDVYAQRIDSSGNQVGGPIPICTGGDYESQPAVTYDSANNRYLVTWTDWAGVRKVMGRLFDQYGTPVGSEMQLSDSSIFKKSNSSCVYNPVSHEFLVVWCDDRNWNGQGNNNDWGDIYGQRVNASTGVLVGGNIAVIAPQGTPYVPDGMDIATAVCNSQDGRYFIALTRLQPAGDPIGGWVTKARILNSDGSGYTGLFDVSYPNKGSGAGTVYNPSANTFVTSYIDADLDISAQRFAASGAALGPPCKVFSSNYEQNEPNLAICPSDGQMMQVTIYFEDKYTGARSNIVAAQRFVAPVLPLSVFTVNPQSGNNVLNWTNPNDPQFTGTKIVYKTTGYPTGPNDGTLVADRATAPGASDTYTHTGLTGGITYYYAAYPHDVYPDYSTASIGSARPDGYPGTPIITVPVSGSNVASITPAIQWTGVTHDAYQVRVSQINDPNTSVNGWDSGTVLSPANTCTSGLLRNISLYYVFARLRNASGWGNWSQGGHWFLTKTGADAGFWYPADLAPSGSGLSLYDSGVESGPGLSSSVVVDGGSNVFKIIDSSTGRQCKERFANSNISFDTGASLAMKMKASGTLTSPGPNAGISNGAVGGMFISVTTTDVKLVDKNGTSVGSYSLDGTAYHKYQLTVKNSTPGNNATAVWNLYVDGTLRVTWTGPGTDDGFDGYMIGAGPLTAMGTWWIDWAAGRADGAYTPQFWEPIDVTVYPPSLPAAPVITTPANGSTTASITPGLVWTSESHDQYQVRIGQLNDPNTSVNGWDSGVVVSPADNCTSGTLRDVSLYYIFARVHNAAGWGPWSASGYTFTTKTNANSVFYPADAFPSSSGWTLYDSGIENGPGLAGVIMADGGSNVFRITDTSTGRLCKEKYAVSNVDFDTGASVLVRMKATGAIASPGPNAGISNGGVGGMFISVTNTDVKLVDKNGTSADSYTLDGTAYHKYQLTVKNAAPGNNATAVWNLYVDGALRITWTGAGTDEAFDGFMLGAAPLAATGTWWIDWAGGRADGAYTPSQWEPTNPDLAPASPAVADDGVYTGSLSKLHGSWSVVSGATQYQYRIGTTAGAGDVVAWTNAGTALELTRTDLSLAEGNTYYFSVQAGTSTTWSESGISNGIIVPTGVSIQASKAFPDSEVRAIRGKTVTAAFTGYFYIQDPMWPCGIKVLSDAAVAAGQTVDVAGAVTGAGGERAIDATSSKVEISPGTGLAATSASNLALGGADLNGLAPGVAGGVGANNLGLFVRCWGRVSNVVGTAYQISDGSGVVVNVQAPDSASVPGDGTFTVVEGISSMDGSRQRVVLVPQNL